MQNPTPWVLTRRSRFLLKVWTLVKFKSEHGISLMHGKVNYFGGLQATFVIRRKREVQSRPHQSDPASVPGPIVGAGPSRPYLDKRWPSRLVATAEEDRLNILPTTAA